MISTPFVRNMKKREEFKIWTSRTSQSSKYLQHGKVILESCLQLDLYFFAVIGGAHWTPIFQTLKKPNNWKWMVIPQSNQTLPIWPSILNNNFTLVPSTFRSQDRLSFSAYGLIRQKFLFSHDRPLWGPDVLLNNNRPLSTFSNLKINTWFNSFWLETEKYMSFIFR